MSEAQITVGMPVFNNDKTLARAVRSVQNQTQKKWRLIITDDCSTDGSLSIAQRFADQDPRITVVRNDTRRVYMNFETSLSMATTPLFVWLAADDYWGPRFLENAENALKTDPKAVSALPACRFSDAPGGPYLPSLIAPRVARIRSFLKAPGGTRMYGLTRTDVLRKAFPDRGMHAYDWYLMLGVLNAGPQITLPDIQFYRQKTPVATYVRDAETQRGLFKWFPVLDASIAALRAGVVPWQNLWDLLRLNLRKHEEYVIYSKPEHFVRLRWLYRLLRLPIASSDTMIREAARASLGTEKEDAAAMLIRKTNALPATQSEPVAAKPKGPERVVAIVTCRNAAPTLARLIENLGAHGAEIIIIDNGSTDDTRVIAEAGKDGPVIAIHDDPFRGSFDLTRQLHLKRDLIRSVDADWIIHADADEFLDSPDGGALRDYLSATPNHITAFVCNEEMYLPLDETERHGAADFETTMRARVAMIERNAKERVFRASASLDRWIETGGHTVTNGGTARSNESLPLRHYFALSLDQVRAEYLSRVYAAHDLAKFWHGARRTEAVDIVAPPERLLSEGDAPQSVRAVPVFAPRVPKAVAAPPPGTDLSLVADPAILQDLVETIDDAVPGLRHFCGLGPAPLPHLHVVAHPAAYCADHDVEGAERWLRRIAGVRQHALSFRVPLLEIRIEDTDTNTLRPALSKLLLGEGTGILARSDLQERTNAAYKGRLKAITANLAADLHYT